MPLRVLDVAPPTAGTADVRLVETTPDQRDAYLCLSHCWGSQVQPIRTCIDTTAKRKQRIAFESMPKTLQDAVNIVRRLGFRYLWIDSLYIVQDDVEDWSLHTSLMADISKFSSYTRGDTGTQRARWLLRVV
jgi:hypothetical protein